MSNEKALAARITEYLSLGGLFNPEQMEHEKVRDLLIDCRAYLFAIVPDEVAGVVTILHSMAGEGAGYFAQEDIARIYRAADLLTALAARAEKAERERDDARKERDENFADAKRASSEYHALGKENLANHQKVRTLEAENAALRARLYEAGKVIAQHEDKIEGLDADLFEAVSVAYRRGAVVWVKENYPNWLPKIAGSGSDELEIWTPLEGFSRQYQISNKGRIRNDSGRIMATTIDRYGYRRISLRVDGKRTLPTVASLVARAFIGPRPDGMQLAHLDGNSERDFADNLAYVTAAENTEHKLVHGTYSVGDNHPRAKLTSSVARAIFADTRPAPIVARDFGIDKSVVRRIRRGEAWAAATTDLRAARRFLEEAK